MNASHRIAHTLLALALATPLAAQAATLTVPADYPTIQGAIAAAADGDEIVVAPGTYQENLRVERKSLSLRSTGGKEVTILDGGGTGSVFVLQGTVQSSATTHYGVSLDGFTFRNGNAFWGGGILADYHCDLAVRNSVITGNTASYGGGLAAHLDAWITATDVVVEGNSAANYGGGTFGYVGAVSVERGRIANNTAGQYGGGGAGLWYCGAVRFSNTVITGNSAGVGGGGVFAAFDSQCNSSFGLVNVVLTKNVAAQFGGGAALMNGPAASSYVTGATVTENVAPAGAGWWNDASTNVGIQNSIFWNNSTPPAFTLNTTYPGIVANSVLEGDPSSTAGFQGDGTNVFADPLFLDAAAGDYRIGADSPAVDLGVFGAIGFAPGGTTTDLTGMARQGRPDAGAFEYDNVAPTVAVTLAGTQGQNGWYVSPVTADVVASDGGVGVASVTFRLPGGTTTVPGDAASLDLTTDGAVTLFTSALDRNGNASAEQATDVAIDQAAPVVAAKVTGTAGTNGWYRSAVTVSLTATDATSGVASLTYAVGSAPAVTVASAATASIGQTAQTVVTWSAADVAGNASASGSLTVKVDTGAPSLSLSVSPTSIKANNKATPVRVGGSASDSLSGLASVAVKVTDRYGRTVATTTLGGTVYLLGTKGQRYTVTATATDKAGNVTVKTATVSVSS